MNMIPCVNMTRSQYVVHVAATVWLLRSDSITSTWYRQSSALYRWVFISTFSRSEM